MKRRRNRTRKRQGRSQETDALTAEFTRTVGDVAGLMIHEDRTRSILNRMAELFRQDKSLRRVIFPMDRFITSLQAHMKSFDNDPVNRFPAANLRRNPP